MVKFVGLISLSPTTGSVCCAADPANCHRFIVMSLRLLLILPRMAWRNEAARGESMAGACERVSCWSFSNPVEPKQATVCTCLSFRGRRRFFMIDRYWMWLCLSTSRMQGRCNLIAQDRWTNQQMFRRPDCTFACPTSSSSTMFVALVATFSIRLLMARFVCAFSLFFHQPDGAIAATESTRSDLREWIFRYSWPQSEEAPAPVFL
jgi:hypothetical protein